MQAMSEIQLRIRATDADERKRAEAALRGALDEAFPQGNVTMGSGDPPRGAVRTRGAAVQIVEFAVTLALHGMVVWEIHKHQQATATTLDGIKKLLGALLRAGIAPERVQVKVNGAFEPLSGLLTRLGIQVDRPDTN